MAEITLNNIWKKYEGNDKNVIEALNLEIKDKEFLVLVGPSGCGKSTVLRMIAGLEASTEGEIFIGGQKVNYIEPKDRDVAMVFQNYALYPHLTVFGNIAYPLKQRKLKRNENGKEKWTKYTKDEIQEKVEEIAKLLKVDHLLKRKPKELSGGERQRVALARAMIRNPKAFLMDEPLSNLDAKLRTQTRSEILKLHRHVETTFVYVTHDQTEALTMGDRIAVMNYGEIQQIDTPYNVFYQPANLFVARFIGSPAMNLMEVECIQVEKGTKVVIPNLGMEFILEKKMEGKVILGIRPEHIHITTQNNNSVRMQVDYSELMGTESVLHLKEGEVELVCKHETEDYKGEKDVWVKWDLNKLHFFDRKTGVRI